MTVTNLRGKESASEYLETEYQRHRREERRLQEKLENQLGRWIVIWFVTVVIMAVWSGSAIHDFQEKVEAELASRYGRVLTDDELTAIREAIAPGESPQDERNW